MSENDQPCSKPWENYSLENLNSGGYRVEGAANWPAVFEAMKAACPQCGKALSQKTSTNATNAQPITPPDLAHKFTQVR